ncbi:Fungal specific transcription factor domain-containing protein [Cladophialophora immunda]|nr:Fungal specific transcription factor domain-containing protein [Cladophialophora immunda]
MLKGLVPPHLALAFLATAVRFSDEPLFRQNRRESMDRYSASAWRYMVFNWMLVDGKPTLDIVQALTLLSILDFTATKLHPGWMKIGLAIRLAQDLRLMFDPTAPESQVVQEEHRRVFWSVYLLDKIVAVGRARPPAILEDDCYVYLPCKEADFRRAASHSKLTIQQIHSSTYPYPERPGAFAVVIAAASVFSSCTRYMLRNRTKWEEPPWKLGSPFAAITSMLLDFESRFDLTGSISHVFERECTVGGELDPQCASHCLLAHVLFRLSYCLLHHPLLLHTRLHSCAAKAPATFLRPIFQGVLQEALAVTDLLLEAEMAGCHPTVSFFGCCITIAGSVEALYTAHEDPSIRQQSVSGFEKTMAYLEKYSRYWSNWRSMITNLQNFAADASSYRDLLNPHGRVELGSSKLERLWRLVDYSAMSIEYAEPVDMTMMPSSFDFDFSPSDFLGEECFQEQQWDAFHFNGQAS